MSHRCPSSVRLEVTSRRVFILAGWIAFFLVAIATTTGHLSPSADSSPGYPAIFFVALIGGATVIAGGASQVLTAAGAIQHEPIVWGLVAGLGNGIGEATSYVLGRTLRRTRTGEQAQTIVHGAATLRRSVMSLDTRLLLFIASVIPGPLVDGLGFVLGGSSYPFRRYFPPVLVGKTIRFVAISVAATWVAG